MAEWRLTDSVVFASFHMYIFHHGNVQRNRKRGTDIRNYTGPLSVDILTGSVQFCSSDSHLHLHRPLLMRLCHRRLVHWFDKVSACLGPQMRVVNNYFSRQNDPTAGFRPHLAGGAAAPDGTGWGVVQLLCLPSSPLQNPTMAVLQQEVQVVPRDFWLESGVCTFQEIKSEISPVLSYTPHNCSSLIEIYK